MPVAPTYPGVYIQEIPSGVRTIAGVATAITAFVGRTRRGPVNEPITINNFGDFERIFGGLWLESSLSFAVQDFFRNGGGQAIVVRVYNAPALPGNSTATITLNALVLRAANPGAWGNKLAAHINTDVPTEVLNRYGLLSGEMFNLYVHDGNTGEVEVFRNISIKPSSRQITRVLESESKLVRAPSPLAPFTDHGVANTPVTEADWSQSSKATGADTLSPASDGQTIDGSTVKGTELGKTGIYALRKADLFNILCLPPLTLDGDMDNTILGDAAAFCESRRAMLLVDPPAAWNDKDDPKAGVGTTSKNAALFFPRLRQANPLRENQIESFVPCGAVAGIFSRTDAQRGVWKAPAGLDATLVGVQALSVSLTDAENGELNPLGVNCLRMMPAAGPVVWGSRTLQGDDRLASEWKYIPVRRTALYIEESLYRGTQWVVFEPNDEPLWAQIRLNVGAFMHNLFRQGAFQGKTPREAYLVKCDSTTTTQNDINLGIVNVIVGFAPLKPAEFVIIKIQQLAGQIDV